MIERVLAATSETVVTLERDSTGTRFVRKRLVAPTARRRSSLRIEAEVLRRIGEREPSVAPRLIDADRHELRTTYVEGVPLSGVKYPPGGLTPTFTAVLALAGSIAALSIPPHLPMVRTRSRLDHGVAAGFLSAPRAARLEACIDRTTHSMAHGDPLPRNLIRRPSGDLVAVDWELARVAPAGYDLAIFWTALLFAPHDREAFLELAPLPPAALLLAALQELRASEAAAPMWPQAAKAVPLLRSICIAAADALQAGAPAVQPHRLTAAIRLTAEPRSSRG